MTEYWSTSEMFFTEKDFIPWKGGNKCYEYAYEQTSLRATPYHRGEIDGQIYDETFGMIDAQDLVGKINYMKSELDNKRPIMAGVHYTLNFRENDGTTDHWISIVQYGSDEDGNWLRYFDNFTFSPTTGTSPYNKLYLRYTDSYCYFFYDDYLYNGRGKPKNYILSNVLTNKK